MAFNKKRGIVPPSAKTGLGKQSMREEIEAKQLKKIIFFLENPQIYGKENDSLLVELL